MQNGGDKVVNIARLKEAMKAKSVKADDVAKALNIDPATFYRRLEKQGTKFTVEEVAKLSGLLKLSPKQMQDIFFDRELA